MDLKQVKRGRALHWPVKISDPTNRVRCGAGSIIDLDAPLEREEFCAGQMYKLQDAPEGATAADIAPIEFRPAAIMVRDAVEGGAKGKAKKSAKSEAKEPDIAAPKEPKRPAPDPADQPLQNVSDPKPPTKKKGIR